MSNCKCECCLFCEDIQHNLVRCTNADLAQESGWENMYFTQGYLEIPEEEAHNPSCFWYVDRSMHG